MDFERDWLDDARRYYTNIVGKYGAQVQSLLKRAAGMEIQMICPLHGPIWRENLEWFLEKYQVSAKDTIAFGDSMNDYQMIRDAACGVAMGNADEKLKAIADRVCETVWEDGVIRELKRMHII